MPRVTSSPLVQNSAKPWSLKSREKPIFLGSGIIPQKKKKYRRFSVDKFKGNIKKYLNNPKDDRKEVSQVKNQRALEEHK